MIEDFLLISYSIALLVYIGGAILFSVSKLISPEKALVVLARDSWGIVLMTLGLALTFTDFFSLGVLANAIFATLGGVGLGIGFLIATPNKITEWLINPENRRSLLGFAAILLIILSIGKEYREIWKLVVGMYNRSNEVTGTVFAVGIALFILSKVKIPKINFKGKGLFRNNHSEMH